MDPSNILSAVAGGAVGSAATAAFNARQSRIEAENELDSLLEERLRAAELELAEFKGILAARRKAREETDE